ncbi:hypothetical protein DC3_22850 [Deinococcus cellulosilyticus NBRC 106333 = KACC 11606]|uniref:Uncharacterized protein n=1 Tax=Deinococcus cellulosilyticus (strain DSM 18568 / NBRC 106333 / KACC 11606 / 5516J-15) TaxID=1223518 RepID=A0A511N191_DEIC1|nr:hypothetical protein DC3_22850 [Deinococcus cellulosilyticus NBRC 106333 = KACC 11606]
MIVDCLVWDFPLKGTWDVAHLCHGVPSVRGAVVAEPKEQQNLLGHPAAVQSEIPLERTLLPGLVGGLLMGTLVFGTVASLDGVTDELLSEVHGFKATP